MRKVCVAVTVTFVLSITTIGVAYAAPGLDDQRFDPDLYWHEQVAAEWGAAGWDQAVSDAVDTFAGYVEAGRVTEALRTPLRAPQGISTVSGGSTGACGGATNGADQFIMRESGGNPNAYNPSGAWGCYQIMPGTWAGAGCGELGAYGSASASVQAQCASRLSLSAWNL